MVEHGTRSRYVYGCRCDACRAASAQYYRGHYKNGHRGKKDSWVTAAALRELREKYREEYEELRAKYGKQWEEENKWPSSSTTTAKKSKPSQRSSTRSTTQVTSSK
jgi:hypothetical protein